MLTKVLHPYSTFERGTFKKRTRFYLYFKNGATSLLIFFILIGILGVLCISGANEIFLSLFTFERRMFYKKD